jgi:hypothetical protein
MSEFYEKQLHEEKLDKLTLLTKSAKLSNQNGEISCREGKGIQSAIKIGPN